MLKELEQKIVKEKDNISMFAPRTIVIEAIGRKDAYADCKAMLESKIRIIETFCISTDSSEYEDGFFDCVRQVVKLLKGESE